MVATWFFLLAFMLTAYVVLDGFDLGAGTLHLLVAKTDAERRTVLAAIGPVWDGNEVWLVASGGILAFAFPRTFAAAFSGFYLPVTILLWLIVLRGMAIELRSHVRHPLWSAFWDTVFAGSSTAIAFVLGVALGNVVRGVPVDGSGYFAAPLFTDFRPGPRPGALDWYTFLFGALGVACLTAHAANYLVWKTQGPVHDRARARLPIAWTLAGTLLAMVTGATAFVAPGLFARFAARAWVWPMPALALASGAASVLARARHRERAAFLGSTLFVAFSLLGAALVFFPTMLPSTLERTFDLDAYNASSAPHGLFLGLVWWTPALAIAVLYFGILFRSIRGKVNPSAEDGH